ncbi:Hypothetical predicted protein [Cloeon dipterum]|uniref:non-specific serine/threonine protein kinase n=2 Tax=Cloeon dipterum TaxID=197152 RepID=A0A8S1DS82_9INSE|nr:Hypothetical predicted protein [Cloeon dipterum]
MSSKSDPSIENATDDSERLFVDEEDTKHEPILSELQAHFDLGETLGQGGFAKVKLARHRLTNLSVAIKCMDKIVIGPELKRIYKEIEALKSFDHPNVCRLLQVIETNTRIYLVLEYCAGSELFDYIVKSQDLTECQARKFFRDMLSGVAYIHQKGYAHRDIKPENMLLDENNRVKLIDFGLCANPAGGLNEQLATCCGSYAYAAPELLRGVQYYGPKADIWSMGVVLFTLLCGELPFEDKNIQNLHNKIQKGRFFVSKSLTADASNILHRMLDVNVNRRITIDELCSHPWVVAGGLKPVMWKMPCFLDNLDSEIVTMMSKAFNMEESKMALELKKWKYDEKTSTYVLLRMRKDKGKALPRLRCPMIKPKAPLRPENQEFKKRSEESATPTRITRAGSLRNRSPRPGGVKRQAAPEVPERISKRLKMANEVKTPARRNPPPVPITPQAPNSIRSPLTTPKNNQATPKTQRNECPTPNSMKTPVQQKIEVKETPSTRKRVMNAINSIFRTPGPKNQKDTPKVLDEKAMNNVSTTACDDPDRVLRELRLALRKQNILCQQKGIVQKANLFAGRGLIGGA